MNRLKKNDGLAWFARTASTILLQKVKEKKSVRIQTRAETLDTPLAEHELDRKNDIFIYDCCRYFRTKGHAALVTADKNLAITLTQDDQGVHTVLILFTLRPRELTAPAGRHGVGSASTTRLV